MRKFGLMALVAGESWRYTNDGCSDEKRSWKSIKNGRILSYGRICTVKCVAWRRRNDSDMNASCLELWLALLSPFLFSSPQAIDAALPWSKTNSAVLMNTKRRATTLTKLWMNSFFQDNVEIRAREKWLSPTMKRQPTAELTKRAKNWILKWTT